MPQFTMRWEFLEGEDYTALFCATLLFSVTSFIKPTFLSFTNESQQSHQSQQCPPVSPMDIESAQKK